MLRADQLDRDRAMVVIVDLQEKLLPLIERAGAVLSRTKLLLAGSKIFELPVVVTEQYPKGLGRTDPAVRGVAVDSVATIHEKSTFSIWAQEEVRQALIKIDRPQIVVAGVETHVCVQQSALDMKSRDFDVFVCADAVGSRTALDHETGLSRMRQNGVFVTTVESVLFELCQRCDTPQFKAMIDAVKRSDAAT